MSESLADVVHEAVERAKADEAQIDPAALLTDRTCPGCGSVHENGADWTNKARERPCDPAGCTQPLNGQGACWCRENGHV